MALSTHKGSLTVTESFSAQNINYPSGSITNSAISGTAQIAASKLQIRKTASKVLADSTTISSFSEIIHVCHAAGTVSSFELMPFVSPTGGDVYKVDLQKGNSSSTFTSVLSAVVSISSDTNDRTVQAGAVTTTSFADGDAFKVVSETTSAAGTMGTGLCVTLNLDENPS